MDLSRQRRLRRTRYIAIQTRKMTSSRCRYVFIGSIFDGNANAAQGGDQTSLGGLGGYNFQWARSSG